MTQGALPPLSGKRIVLFNWRDLHHPKAGGAEIYTDFLLRELSLLGASCTWFASSVAGRDDFERFEHYDVVRHGNEITCRFAAVAWLRALGSEIDIVIDEVNTLPWLSRFIRGPKVVLLMHQLAREVWWKEARFPLSLIGFVLEPILLQIYRDSDVIAVSRSTAESLREYGLRGQCITIENVLPKPHGLSRRLQGSRRVGYVGRVTPSKRVDEIIRAFHLVHAKDPSCRLVIIGRGPDRYSKQLKALVERLSLADAVEFLGRLTNDERDVVVSSLDCLVMASVREGWGLVVSEAAAFGVPTVAYDVAGLRDAICDGSTGILVPNGDWRALGEAVWSVLSDAELNARLGANAADLLNRFQSDSFVRKVRTAFERFSTN